MALFVAKELLIIELVARDFNNGHTTLLPYPVLDDRNGMTASRAAFALPLLLIHVGQFFSLSIAVLSAKTLSWKRVDTVVLSGASLALITFPWYCGWTIAVAAFDENLVLVVLLALPLAEFCMKSYIAINMYLLVIITALLGWIVYQTLRVKKEQNV